ncbi:Uncharacterised protein [Mycobacteroides abscessus subsp. abscessus]|nr:Uncharacterised protein [Mycobacteroides abscessus subsp. abscessus]
MQRARAAGEQAWRALELIHYGGAAGILRLAHPAHQQMPARLQIGLCRRADQYAVLAQLVGGQ